MKLVSGSIAPEALRGFAAAALVLGASAGLATSAAAQPAPLAQVARPDSVTALRPDTEVLGEADPAARVQFNIALRPRDVEMLTARADVGEQTPVQELKDRFLPTEADYAGVLAWLRGTGLTIEKTSATRLSVTVSGTATEVARVLAVHFSTVRREGRVYTSADSVPSVPADVSDAILGINGLQPQHRLHLPHVSAEPTQAFSGYTPTQILTAYFANVTQKGFGETTAVIIDAVPSTSDVSRFWSIEGVSQSLSNLAILQAGLGNPDAPSGEETLDTEWSSSIAPLSKVRVYVTDGLTYPDIDQGYEAVILDITNGIKISQVSISIDGCELAVTQSQSLTDIYYHAILDNLGATVLIASGDQGSQGCGPGNGNVPEFDGTSPYVTTVGGTSLVLQGSQVVSETGWSGSTGGLSILFKTPSYQTAIGAPSRAVPDVSAVADLATGVQVFYKGRLTVFGGTSVATPIWAGFLARINQARASSRKSSLGQLNPRIYSLIGSADFRDITRGSNGGYSAGRGYDLVTGIGTPIVSRLLATLLNQK